MTPDRPYWSDAYKAVGGNPAVDFANTLSDRTGNTPKERLVTYDDVVSAAERIGVIEPDEARRLRAAAEGTPDVAEAVRRQAIAFREDVYDLLVALAVGDKVPAGALIRFNEALGSALGHLRVADKDDAFVWEWNEHDGLDRVLWPFARAGAELLVTGRLDRLRVCDADDCGWLFLDLSRNRSRRWCDMADCGNRAKARRFQSRQRERT